MPRNDALAGLKVRDIRHLVVEEPSVISPEASIEDLLETMLSDVRTRHVYVVDGKGRLVGVVRMQDVVKYLFPFTAAEEGGETRASFPFLGLIHFDAEKVEEMMNREPLYVLEDTPLREVGRLLIRAGINELPVVDEDMRVVGQVNVYEIIKGYLGLKKGAS